MATTNHRVKPSVKDWRELPAGTLYRNNLGTFINVGNASEPGEALQAVNLDSARIAVQPSGPFEILSSVTVTA